MGMIRRSISSGKLPSFRLSRGAPRSPTMKSTPISSTVEAADDIEDNSSVEADGGKQQVLGRKIMIVVDSSRESKVALLWALSHTAQSQDTILLLNVVKPSSSSSSSSKSSSNININVSHAVDGEEMTDPRSYDLLCAMKRISQQKKPEVKVEICLVEGKDKGPVIVEAAKKQGAALLVLGSRKRRPMMVMWRLLLAWRGRGSGNGSRAVVDYCIKNASCMAVGVRRRGKRGGGGYLITTRKHKDFWLLA